MGEKKTPKGADLDLTADPDYDDARYRDLHASRTGETVVVRDGPASSSNVLVLAIIVFGGAWFMYSALGVAAVTSAWISLIVVAVLQLVAVVDDAKLAAKLLRKVSKKLD